MTTPMSALRPDQAQPKMPNEPEEGYMAMAVPAAGGYLQPRDGSMRSPNHRARSSSSPRGLEMSHTGFTRSEQSSSQDAHNLHSQLNQSSQRILSSQKSINSPVSGEPFKLSAMPSYENSADAGRYVPPPAAGHAQNGPDRSATPEAPFYGETNQYSVIGATTKRTDSVIYGNKTASRKRRRKSEGQDERRPMNSGSLIFFIIAVLVLVSLASLGLSVYVVATRSSSSESSGGTAMTSPVQQEDIILLEQRVVDLTSRVSDMTLQLSALNVSQQSESLSAAQRISSNEASLAGLQQATTLNTNSIDGALSNISYVQTQLTSNTIRGLTDVYPLGLLFNCTEIMRSCTVTASVAGSVESCDNVNFPVVIPQGLFIVGVLCEADILFVNTVLARLDVGQDVGYSCNCQFPGPPTAKDAFLTCTTRVTACQRSSL